jgi:hypothetical protein
LRCSPVGFDRCITTASSTPASPVANSACAAGSLRSTPRPARSSSASYTLPSPGELGADTWPADTDHAMRGGAAIWNTPALDPQLGLIYFATGNCGPDFDGSMRVGGLRQSQRVTTQKFR